ncbi:hypothetical protein GCK72_010932 [Caenorhabditis remanei]|uniref:Uncharacterized protein n=1 Tax=Caenorhabditis remanei TaxID=31234 RepID=A0A6A5H482_CAERE|nr:hypothetical protein GCK72_010932 [Caenorhabditis remanei]KAF1762670.1 hypothetical protein GCK72_010932 [Caenorhabditis remanei]
MDSTASPLAFPIEISRKNLMEKRRHEGINKAVKDIKDELIQQGYATEKDLKSQNDVLFCAARVVAEVDLKQKYPTDVPMKNLIEAVGRRKARAGKMQFRRMQKADALKNLKDFIMRNELGTVAQR